LLSRDDAEAAAPYLDQAEQLYGSSPAAEDVFELRVRRARVATLRGEAKKAIALAREACDLAGTNPIDEGLAFSALGEALTLGDEPDAADQAFRRGVGLLEEQGHWRDATNACRAWARMLRQVGREQQALDVLDRAAELAMRATPADARVER
jgi:tetratricopeptide (TPR) repeat protein